MFATSYDILVFQFKKKQKLRGSRFLAGTTR